MGARVTRQLRIILCRVITLGAYCARMGLCTEHMSYTWSKSHYGTIVTSFSYISPRNAFPDVGAERCVN